MRCIHIGLLCVQENVVDRPTMASVVLMLNDYFITLEVPSPPALFMNSSRPESADTSLQWEHASSSSAQGSASFKYWAKV
ncbi:hypothetical protein SLA2020_369290 [Shorea laevis]